MSEVRVHTLTYKNGYYTGRYKANHAFILRAPAYLDLSPVRDHGYVMVTPGYETAEESLKVLLSKKLEWRYEDAKEHVMSNWSRKPCLPCIGLERKMVNGIYVYQYRLNSYMGLLMGYTARDLKTASNLYPSIDEAVYGLLSGAVEWDIDEATRSIVGIE